MVRHVSSIPRYGIDARPRARRAVGHLELEVPGIDALRLPRFERVRVLDHISADSARLSQIDLKPMGAPDGRVPFGRGSAIRRLAGRLRCVVGRVRRCWSAGKQIQARGGGWEAGSGEAELVDPSGVVDAVVRIGDV